jgi:uncharacterized SAM-binding protein YcdF (DUF218 family)
MFILKKLISGVFYPVPLCLGILAVGLLLLFFTRRQRAGKRIVLAGVILLAALSYGTIPNIFLKQLEYQYQPLYLTEASGVTRDDHLSSIKWIVVLGGGHVPDPKIPITSQISSASLVRLIEAVRLYKRIPGSKLIVSGGKIFELTSEAETMAGVATAIGVNHEDLILEEESKDTAGQALLIKSIVGDDKFVLVTSAAHIPRSVAMFKKLGMHPVPAPTGHFVNGRQGIRPGTFFPGSRGLLKAECAFHEYLGYIWGKLRGQI